MNWENAKAWLIGLFLILDALLGWQLIASRQVMNGYVESSVDRLANTKTMLADHGFQLTVSEIPTKQPSLPSFKAQVVTPSLMAIGQAVFPKGTSLHIQNSIGGVASNDGQISTNSDGSWQVTYAQPQPIDKSHTVRSYIFDGSSYQIDQVYSNSNHNVYLQAYKGYPIFDSQLITRQSGKSLLSYTQSELTSISVTSDPKPVISAMDALDSLANAVDKSGSTHNNKILTVDLGYARKVPLYQSNETTNYWFPVWRVVTQNEAYYVNAFTGEVELAP